MKPVFFPFTYISDQVVQASALFFDKAIVYQPGSEKFPDPVARGSEEGLLEIRSPVGGDEQKLDKLLAEYRQWLDRHRGSEMTFFKTRLFESFGIDTIPCFTDTATSQIKAEIKKMKNSEPEVPQRPEPLFTARFFLWVAQEFDMQHNDINRDLAIFRDMENELFTCIMGENDLSENSPKPLETVITEDPGQYKTFQRFTAWLKLFEQAPVFPDKHGTLFLLTHSRAVLNFLLESQANTQIRKIFETPPVFLGNRSGEEIKKCRETLNHNIDKLSENLSTEGISPLHVPVPSSEFASRLEIYAAENSPWSLLKTENQPEPYDIRGSDSEKFKKTFLGLLETKIFR